LAWKPDREDSYESPRVSSYADLSENSLGCVSRVFMLAHSAAGESSDVSVGRYRSTAKTKKSALLTGGDAEFRGVGVQMERTS
jgi:hypothetical protein